jgi:hypothetical protein
VVVLHLSGRAQVHSKVGEREEEKEMVISESSSCCGLSYSKLDLAQMEEGGRSNRWEDGRTKAQRKDMNMENTIAKCAYRRIGG